VNHSHGGHHHHGSGLVSAHRGGGGHGHGENSRGALERAAALGCEFVEFDVQVTSDGQFVLFHDARVRVGRKVVPISSVSYQHLVQHRDLVTLPEAVQILAGKAKAHVDLKFVSPDDAYAHPDTTMEVKAVAQVLEHLGADAFIVTTQYDRSVRALRDWSDTHAPGLLVGLSIGRGLVGVGPVRLFRYSELFPQRRLEASRANLVVVYRGLARMRLAAVARRLGLPLLVYTVDNPRALRHWLSRAWLVTTNVPAQALTLRADDES